MTGWFMSVRNAFRTLKNKIVEIGFEDFIDKIYDCTNATIKKHIFSKEIINGRN